MVCKIPLAFNCFSMVLRQKYNWVFVWFGFIHLIYLISVLLRILKRDIRLFLNDPTTLVHFSWLLDFWMIGHCMTKDERACSLFLMTKSLQSYVTFPTKWSNIKNRFWYTSNFKYCRNLLTKFSPLPFIKDSSLIKSTIPNCFSIISIFDLFILSWEKLLLKSCKIPSSINKSRWWLKLRLINSS